MNKVHIILHDLNHSGTSHASVVLANKLGSCQITIIGEKKASPFALSDNVKLAFLGIRRPKTLIEKILYIPRSSLALWGYIRQEKPENLMVYGKEFGCICLLLRYFSSHYFKIIIVNSTYISGQLKYMKNYLSQKVHRYIYRNLLNKAEHLIAICNGVSEDMIKNYNVRVDKITTIYPAISSRFFEPQEIFKESNEILFIGRLDKYKSPETLLSVFKSLASTLPQLKLRFVGDGPLREMLEKSVDESGLQDQIFFEGVQSDVIPYIKNASVLALTSQFEGFGMVLAETIACGVPIISFDCPTGPSEVIIEDVNGYLVPQGNSDLLAKRLETALAKKWDRRKIIDTAARFHPDITAKGQVDVMKAVFADTPTASHP